MYPTDIRKLGFKNKMADRMRISGPEQSVAPVRRAAAPPAPLVRPAVTPRPLSVCAARRRFRRD